MLARNWLFNRFASWICRFSLSSFCVSRRVASAAFCSVRSETMPSMRFALPAS